MIKWNAINSTAKASGMTPAQVVQNWIDATRREREELEENRTRWQEYRSTSSVKFSDLTKYAVFENGHCVGYDLDTIAANEDDDTYDYAAESMHFQARKIEIEKRFRPIWQALENAGLLEVSESDMITGVGISDKAYDIASGKLAQEPITKQLFADYNLTEEDLS